MASSLSTLLALQHALLNCAFGCNPPLPPLCLTRMHTCTQHALSYYLLSHL